MRKQIRRGYWPGTALLLIPFLVAVALFFRKDFLGDLSPGLENPYVPAAYFGLFKSEVDPELPEYAKLRKSIAAQTDSKPWIQRAVIYSIDENGRLKTLFDNSGLAKIGYSAEFTPPIRASLETGRFAYRFYRNGFTEVIIPSLDENGKPVGLYQYYLGTGYWRFFLIKESVYIALVFASFLLWILGGIVYTRRLLVAFQQFSERFLIYGEHKGDLTLRLGNAGDAAVAPVFSSIDRYVETLYDTMKHVNTHCIHLSDVVKYLETMTAQIKELGEQGSIFLERSQTTNEEFAASLEVINHKTSEQERIVIDTVPMIHDLMAFILKVHENATIVNDALVTTLREVKSGRDMVHSVAEEIELINSSSGEIENIVEVIEGISDQVALLSLNASIEAARAGDHGRGFAVVAEEISKLSDNTAGQIKDIADIVLKNRTETLLAVQQIRAMEETYQKIHELVTQAEHYSGVNKGKALENRQPAQLGIQSLEKISTTVHEIAQSVDHQSGGIKELLENMSSMTQMAHSLLDISTEANNNVSRLAEELQSIQQAIKQIRV